MIEKICYRNWREERDPRRIVRQEILQNIFMKKISVERKRNNDGAGAGREICESNVLE